AIYYSSGVCGVDGEDGHVHNTALTHRHDDVPEHDQHATEVQHTTQQALLHLLLFVPLVYLTALVITALFGMPALIRVVAERDYPQLERKNGGSFVGSVWSAVVAVVLFIALWLVTLPLWLIGAGVIVPFVAAAYLNQRLFRYDAIAEHASAEEMATLFKQERGGWWGLGLLTGLVQFVPLLNLVGPVFAALAFIHYGLARLEQRRRQGSV
ncbi:MAG: EI24 domain-containing protein, partial [Thiobacillus sp.]|nr:EI24 domain-containing protein [Thiobacillus sp.]